MAAKDKDPGPEIEVDFGDESADSPVTRIAPTGFSSRGHPADQEWEPPQRALVPAGSTKPRSTKVNGSNPHQVDRVLPHSIEAEEYLLSCCLLDGEDVVGRCLEARIAKDSFYEKRHGIIYARLVEMRAKKLPIDVSTLAEELKAAKELGEVGGIAFITQVSSRMPTTAQSGYYIDKVREQALLREMIRSATAVVESTYNFSGEIDAFMSDQAAKFRTIIDRADVTGSPLISLTDFSVPDRSDRSVLLGNRYLNRGDGAVIVGTSGMGKSSMSIQAATLFALGRPAFGIPCNGPLTSLIIQSEDSDGDIGEMWLSIMHTLKLSDKQITQVRERVKIQSERVRRGDQFITQLRKTVAKVKPDLVWINPLQAFMDGDVTDSKDLGRFLREGLNGINPGLFGYILVHHTTKPATGKDKTERLWHEVMYDMAGGAEIINWARAILSLRAAPKEGEFNLVLAKRGRRAGVTKEVDQGAGKRLEPSTTVPLRHAKGFIPAAECGLERDLPIIFWEEREPDVAPETGNSKGGRPPKHEFKDYRNIFPQKNSPGMELAPLHRTLVVNKDISKAALHHALQRWAEEGFIEVIQPDGKPTRYRMAL